MQYTQYFTFYTHFSLFLNLENNSLNTRQQLEHDNFKDYINLRKNLYKQGKAYVQLLEDDAEVNELRKIAAGHSGRSSIMAQNILCFVFGECNSIYDKRDEANLNIVPNQNATTAFTTQQLKKENENVSISPNPANDQVQFSFSNWVKGQKAQLSLIDVQGKKVLETSLIQAKQNVKLDQLKKGMYFYRIVLNNEIIKDGKLILQ